MPVAKYLHLKQPKRCKRVILKSIYSLRVESKVVNKELLLVDLLLKLELELMLLKHKNCMSVI